MIEYQKILDRNMLNVFKDIKHISKSSSELFLYDHEAKHINSIDITNDKGEAPFFLERKALIKTLRNKIPDNKILNNVDVNQVKCFKEKIKLETNDKNLSVIISLTHLVTMIQILFLNQMLLQFGALARMNMKFFKN